MHRKRLSSSTSSNGSGNGLVMLYEAAMLIEQQNVRVPIPKPAFPPATSLAKPLLAAAHSRSRSVSNGSLALSSTSFNQPQTAFRVPVGSSAASTRVRVEPTGHGGYQVVGAYLPQQQQLATTIHNGVPVTSGKRSASGANSSANSRTSHNELEKNRRAHLRQCLDILRDQLPLGQSEATRLTMLSVLTKSHAYLKYLQSLDSRQKSRLLTQQRRHRELLHRREQLKRTLRILRKRLANSSGQQQQQQQQQQQKSNSSAVVAPSQLSRNRRPASQRQQQISFSVTGSAAAPTARKVAATQQWRCRTASEISAVSVSSEDLSASAAAAAATVATSNAAVIVAVSAPEARRGGSCGTPDSGYASPPNCSNQTAAATETSTGSSGRSS
ncbi:hypothetical protein BOX15_Mlig015214g1 [Macrostomum lignano]|uniref:BHLH domain-containing protein n=1 Tax=Macrostomum lignano TaxID=282301 RepID=A0A267FR59_9PLAT|nr:hypothetical protein BOX15_Mlig015214g1 [Macrostomum lignano]